MKEGVKERKLINWVVFTWLFTGAIDILLAFVINDKTPVPIVLKYVASGVFGNAAFRGGTGMVYCGLLFHFCFALLWVTFFFLFYPIVISILKFRSVLIMVTGLTIWLVMNLVVAPLSNTPPQQFHILAFMENISALLLAFGLPITFVADKFYKPIYQLQLAD